MPLPPFSFPLSFAALFLAFGASAFAQSPVSLMQPGKPALGWSFDNGQEFPGARGSLEIDPTEAQGGQPSLKLTGDFRVGGNYVQAATKIDGLDIGEFSFWIKGQTSDAITVRLIDAAGRCHQLRLAATPQDDWQHIVFPLTRFFANQGKSSAVTSVTKYEAWGGGKDSDGKWTGPAKSVVILLGPLGEQKVRTVWISGVTITPPVAESARTGMIVYTENFENDFAGWTNQGSVQVATGEGFKSEKALALEKQPNALRDEVSAIGPTFPVNAGSWEIAFATRTELESMDNSYNGTLALQLLDATGKVVATKELATPFRKTSWEAGHKVLEVPVAAVTARFTARITKESPGKFWIDELAAAPLTGKAAPSPIQRLMFTTAQLGNLLFPNDSRVVELEVWSKKALPEDQRAVNLLVTDYWGAEQNAPLAVPMEDAGQEDDLYKYKGKADLAGLPLEIGRYYELHGTVAAGGAQPFSNYSSLAILPEAAANAFPAAEVPFTARNWDNRLEPFVRLAHRLGIRICGVWGKMDSDPAKVEVPQIELIKELGMGILTGSPAHEVEQRREGYETKYSEENLRKGVQNFVKQYGDIHPLIVNLGNEPHTQGDDVKVDIAAYKAVYTELKKLDPSIYVVGTSIGTQEEAYFKNGFGEWCDAYDFHVYEDALSVRKIIGQKYPAMFARYGFAKPIWSTELGLNSQGMARDAVAAELYKKAANFFAVGGANMSWFGLLYPDKEGTQGDTFGSAHNTFDCRYNKYAPKMDAIVYYNTVNAIAIKKYIQDKTYYGNLHDFLFQDKNHRSLQILYKDKGREDVGIPLPGVGEVQVIRLDGTRSILHAGNQGITLTINEEPLLLLYEGGPASLPEALGPPAISLGEASASLIRGEPGTVNIDLHGNLEARVSVKAPPFWKVEEVALASTEPNSFRRYNLSVPPTSTALAVDMIITLTDAEGRLSGELFYRPAVTGSTSIQILPVPAVSAEEAAVKLIIHNNGADKQQVSWDVALTGQQALDKGAFSTVRASDAYFTEAPSGTLEVSGHQSTEVRLPLGGADLTKVYRAKATARDAEGHTVSQERPLAAFYGVPKVQADLALDGGLDEADWQRAPVRKLDEAEQFYAFPAKENAPAEDWMGPDDLSAEIRYLWDERNFYVGVKVTDNTAGGLQPIDSLWAQDGLQFLIDPLRASDRKVGKYDYAVAIGQNGPAAFCHLSADAAAPNGPAPEIKVAAVHRPGGGDITYEIAIPWSRLAPFKPAPGQDLGLTLILNEDDGKGRDAFMTWFGNAHNKDIDTVGDLILEE